VKTPAVETKLNSIQKLILQPKDAIEDITASVETKAEEAGEILCKKDVVEEEQIDANEDLKSQTGEVIDENDEGFIGPKLPRMMTKAEVKAFKAELFAKYKF
jgi:hypothetical protein